jgi:hypothetical protein
MENLQSILELSSHHPTISNIARDGRRLEWRNAEKLVACVIWDNPISFKYIYYYFNEGKQDLIEFDIDKLRKLLSKLIAINVD